MIKNEQSIKGFWNGFLAGSVAAGLLLYAFGTKKGRNGLKTLLLFSENLDENIHKILNYTLPAQSKKNVKYQGSLLETITTILDKIQYASKHT